MNSTVTGSTVGDFILLALCLFASGFFSSTETALTALPPAKARQLLELKPRLSKALNLWVDHPNRVLTTVLIGNNVINTFTAALATIIAQALFDNSALSIAVALTTVALLVFGEITPKTFAKSNAAFVAPLSMRLIKPLYYGLFPIVVVFTWISKLLVHLSGGDTGKNGPFVTEEDIDYMLTLGERQGVIESDERDMIANVIEFSDTLVKEVMIPRTEVDGLPMDADMTKILESIQAQGRTRMPVYRDSLDDIVGFLHTKDVLRALPNLDGFDMRAALHPPVFVPELERISELLRSFQRDKTHLAIVVDEYGGTAGIVSLEDILEEIVGEIRDEHDEDDESEFKKIGEDRYIAEGKASIAELAEELGISAGDGPYETVAGFIISHKGRMPSRGTRFVYEGWVFTVLDVDARRIAKVGIERAPTRATSEAAPVSTPNLRVVK